MADDGQWYKQQWFKQQLEKNAIIRKLIEGLVPGYHLHNNYDKSNILRKERDVICKLVEEALNKIPGLLPSDMKEIMEAVKGIYRGYMNLSYDGANVQKEADIQSAWYDGDDDKYFGDSNYVVPEYKTIENLEDITRITETFLQEYRAYKGSFLR